MDVREKLALSLCNATQKTNYKCEFNCEKKGKCAYCLVMAEQMIANGVTVQEWISVKDRLPEREGTYLIHTTKGSVYSAHFYEQLLVTRHDGSQYVRESGWGIKGYSNVTHWMPLPEPPKEETQTDCTYNKNGHCIGQKLMPECDAKNCDRRK